MRIPAFYSDAYAPGEEPLLARLRATRDLLQRLALVDLQPATPVRPAQLDGLHDPTYLQAFLDGREPLASRQGIRWTPRVRDATLAMLGGQLAATDLCLAHPGGIAMNIARGFHHAHPLAGSGFCAINGLALVAHAHPTLRVMVVDCDEHGGNGTEEFAARMPNLFAVSIFGTRFGCRGGTRSWAFHVAREEGFERYARVLEGVGRIIDDVAPDLLIYQAGADCHEHDPKSQLRLRTGEMFRRDLAVFTMARERRLPVLFLVAGGYQDATRVARLNCNTVRAARIAQQPGRSAKPDGLASP